MFGQPFEVRQAFKTALIPERDTANGPITSARLRRAGLGYLALAVAGINDDQTLRHHLRRDSAACQLILEKKASM